MSGSLAVVMPVYNGASFLAEALDSILAQQHDAFDLIVVDDGSTDATPDILADYARRDGRVRPITQAQSGVAAAINRGLAETDSEFVARMDADDIASPERLATQLDFLATHPDVQVVGTDIRLVDQQGRRIRVRRYPSGDAEIRSRLLFKNPLCHPTVMFRRTCVTAAGGYDECYRSAQDLDLWLRLSPDVTFANIPQPLLDYRTHVAQITGRANRGASYAFSVLAALNHLFAAHGMARLQPPEPAPAALTEQIVVLFDRITDPLERNALFYQTARVLRRYPADTVRPAARTATRYALREGRMGYLARRGWYAFSRR